MTSYVPQGRLPDFSLWGKIADRRVPLDFYLEITARCNNNCSQCYINLPAGDLRAIRMNYPWMKSAILPTRRLSLEQSGT